MIELNSIDNYNNGKIAKAIFYKDQVVVIKHFT